MKKVSDSFKEQAKSNLRVELSKFQLKDGKAGGKNLVNFTKLKGNSLITCTIDEDTYTLVGKLSSYPSVFIDITEIIKQNPNKYLCFDVESCSITNQNAQSNAQINTYYNDGTPNMYNSIYNFKTKNRLRFLIPSNADNIREVRLSFYTNNTVTSYENTLVFTKPILYFGKLLDNEYEPYIDGTIIDGELITDGFLQEIGMSDDKLIGNAIAKNVELNVYNWKEINYLNQEIVFYTGLVNTEGKEEYVKHGSFIVDSVEEDEEKGLLKLKALDFMIKLNQPFVDTLDWSVARTLKEFAKHVLSQCDLELANEDFPNADYVLTQQPAFEGFACRYVMGKIAEIAGSNVYINEDDKVEIKLKNTETPPEDIDVNSVIEMEITDVDYRPYNAVMIKLADGVEGENITKRDEDSIAQYGERTLTITSNEFAINEDVRRDLIEQIFDYINGFYYYPLKMTYNSYDWLERCDRIRAYYNDTDYYDTILINHTIEFPASIKSSIENDAVSAVNSKYEYTTEMEQRFGHTEIVVDKLNQKIDSTITNVGENTDKITQITQTTDSIMSQVGETQIFINDVNNQLNTEIEELQKRIIENSTLIQQTKDSVITTINKTGGNNRIRNSVGFKDAEYWILSENANVSTSQDTDTEQTTISGSKFIISSGDMRTDFTTIIGNSYTVSFKLKKTNIGTPNSISIELHRSESDYDVLYSGTDEITKWKEISYSYQATTSTPYILFKSNGDKLEFSDFIVNDGDPQPWSQYFDEVYGKNHQLDTTGLSLSDTLTDEKSKLDNNNLIFKEGNKEVAELSKDRVYSNSAEIVRRIKIGNFTFEAIDNDNMILY